MLRRRRLGPEHRRVAERLARSAELKRHDADFRGVKTDYHKEFWEAVLLRNFEDLDAGFAEIADRQTYGRAKPLGVASRETSDSAHYQFHTNRNGGAAVVDSQSITNGCDRGTITSFGECDWTFGWRSAKKVWVVG